tara:strand:- start:25 stop:276 length:252 start_codon:yes stop_codon:yes gene_type:complete
MMNGWTVPAVGIFLVTQASAAVWWASSTNNQVESNTIQIEQVIDNEKQIAVIEVRQSEMQKDISEIKKRVNDIFIMLTKRESN